MSEAIEEQPGAELDLDVEVARLPELEADTAPKPRGASPVQLTLVHGMSHLYSYGPIAGLNSGQLAVATLLDLWGVVHFGLPRTVAGVGDANDNRAHFPPQFAVEVAKQMQTGGLFGAPIPNKENIAAAFHRFGMQAVITFAAAFGNGNNEVAALKNWVSRNGIPVVCLLDGGRLYAGGQLRWSVFCGWTDQHALLAEEGQIRRIPWQQFQDAWHCGGLPWPNNYMAVTPYLPAKQ